MTALPRKRTLPFAAALGVYMFLIAVLSPAPEAEAYHVPGHCPPPASAPTAT